MTFQARDFFDTQEVAPSILVLVTIINSHSQKVMRWLRLVAELFALRDAKQ
jgi:hypothetical protein